MVRSILVIVSLFFLCACERQPATRTPPVTSTQPAQPAATAPQPQRTPSQVVTDFGARMKNVPTTAPPDVVAKALRQEYAGLVDTALLDAWTKAPADAPGRPVSSPWPDRIEVTSSPSSASEATVDAVMIEMTSTGEGRRIPIRVRLRNADVGWRITAFETIEEDAHAAVAIIRAYYDAISARDHRRAFALWGRSGPPGQTFEAFSAGFAETASVEVTTGTPSRVDAAAGSRYVEVPVTIVAVDKKGATTHYEGTYTLRRSVIEGGDPSWHLYRASIRNR